MKTLYHSQMNKQVLIFDFDGTIADTFDLVLAISNKLSYKYKFKQILPSDVAFLKDHTLEEVIRHLNVSVLKIPFILLRSRRELYKQIVDIKPIPGLAQVLRELKRQKFTMGILTTNSAKNVRHFLASHDLDVFDFIHSSTKIFGKHNVLIKLIRRKRFDKDNVFYIGDETRDIKAANKAGIQSIAVSWGYNSAKALQKQKPTQLLEKPNQLLDL
jgi:phosphoglycolate phosphatase-like HAD superfamily hydrolase